MLKNNVLSESKIQGNQRLKIFSSFLLSTVVVIALLFGIVIGVFGSSALIVVIGAMLLVIIIIARQNELAATIIIAVHLYADWYLGLAFVAQIITVLLLLALYIAKSIQYPWEEPRNSWLWILFIVLGIFPATHGIDSLDSAYYYFNVIFSSLIMFWLGLVLARDATSVRRLFILLSIFGTLIALHTILEATTGIFLLRSTRYDTALQALSNFQLYGTNTSRAEGFLLNPDTNGTFLAVIFFLPFSLFIESSSPLKKSFYFVEMFLVLIALLFTYSTGAWLAAIAGFGAFIVLVGRTRYYIIMAITILFTGVVLLVFFPAQINLQLHHVGDEGELPLRIAAWQTALNVIHARPFAGLGLGRYVYMVRSDPYRVAGQFIPLYHPQNSYLELGSLGGIQIAILFITLLLFALYLAFRNWMQSGVRTRALLAGGIAAVVALSINSLAVAGWTCGPIGAMGWLILGSVSSTLLNKSLNRELKS